jgi:predicted MPP superfamily phosphohydrolase
MAAFLLTFFLIYGGMHFYVFLKAKAALAFGAKAGIPIGAFMLLMVLAPVIVRFSERYGLDLFARIMSYVGFIWFGLLFLFFSASIAIDVYRTLAFLLSLISKKAIFTPDAKLSFYIPLAFAMIASFYGYFEARAIRLEKVTITTSKLPEEVRSLRIVQISDIHLGLIVRQERLKRILSEVKAAGPDILVSTGDLVDGEINSLPGLAELLKDINPRYGKYAITGNHEFYAGLKEALAFTEKAGFRILRGEAIAIDGLINIAGVDDRTGRRFGLSEDGTEQKVLKELSNGRFTVLLKHIPLVDKESLGLFDLQLSGHTHKGQIFPFNIATWLYYPRHSGLMEAGRNSRLYVSRGSGTWGPPIRFLSPPEVTLIELVRP